ncbi:hypothetical protein RB195_008307 [Necator americanus]|uniref:AP2/ERF domain-containing protein n=1 Tax=Necator americanus TaxID=51031 RepID=A0ABR1CNY3_NECAM
MDGPVPNNLERYWKPAWYSKEPAGLWRRTIVRSKRHEARTFAQAAALEAARWSVAVGIVSGSSLPPSISAIRHGPPSIPTAVSNAALRAQPLTQLSMHHVVLTWLLIAFDRRGLSPTEDSVAIQSVISIACPPAVICPL